MKIKPYVVAEYYYPKSEHVDELMNILIETSAMIKEVDGALMSLSLKPEKKMDPLQVFPCGKAVRNSLHL